MSGYVPFEGSIFDTVPIARQRLKATLSTAGAADIRELHKNAVLELQTASALEASRVNNITVLRQEDETLSLSRKK
ncbi:MAG: hypothetical protein JXA41_11915 [Deltaproteobacteria bacterium]|nr:hypothetical protein [Deltaproteobacteria bacterium]